ncbi:hypothetical protein KK092_09685 [Curtobacterium flaccumfaciens pv. flaccumfaciens]|uniref:hypothetical protein n=1 Tax=Curtobacterium flaccumfaciens TaxID=2035 RepID=UPI001BDEF915|nr:hypothetical protein [Curtobacterium flaccumfaciens]MBT1669652.1 hypothetical protein [Curtobacterium flaccumfaciens pv. flaccumfaciens]
MKRRNKPDAHKPARVRLLAAEMDKRLDAAVRRGTRFDTKAGFIVTASGIVAGSSALRASASPLAAWAGVPIALALCGVAAAVWALWTRSIDVPNGRKIVNGFVDKPVAPEELEDSLLELRTKEVEARDAHADAQGKAVKTGFVMLALAVMALLIFVVAVGQTAPAGDTHGTQAPTPAAIGR